MTCEHAGNFIPPEYQQKFANHKDLLNSHRGYDPGAYDLFQELLPLSDFHEFQSVSRLVVELNRSLHHPQLFSEISKRLSSAEKENILQEYYYPYRNKVTRQIERYITAGESVFHLSVHSFTPVLSGEERRADIGLLYDPSRVQEKKICHSIKEHLQALKPELRIRFNYPYLGKADGFTTFLRDRFPSNYSGIELEVNQKFVEHNKMIPALKKALQTSLSETLEKFS